MCSGPLMTSLVSLQLMPSEDHYTCLQWGHKTHNWCHQRTTTHDYNEVTRLTTDVIRGPLHMFTVRSHDSQLMSLEDHYTCLQWDHTTHYWCHQRTTTHVYNEVTWLTTDVIRGPLHMFTMRSQDSQLMSSEDHYTCLQWGHMTHNWCH
jgi:hypothetical protein